MATATLTSVEEYLATSYRPDRELLDGQLVERNLGEYDHSDLQTALAAWFRNRRHQWNIRVVVEQRVQVKPDRFRIPDVSVISRDVPIEQILRRPPLLCAEILSKDDTLASIQERVDDYLVFGVPNIWILDPAKRRAYVCSQRGFVEPENGILAIPGTPIQIPLMDLFADLD